MTTEPLLHALAVPEGVLAKLPEVVAHQSEEMPLEARSGPSRVAFMAESTPTSSPSPAVPNEETVGGRPLPAGTDPAPDPELSQQATDQLDAFVRLLAPPAAQRLTSEARRGREAFARVGCPGCHVPALRTGDSPIAALRHREVAAYTDLLLHDMGPQLADICLAIRAAHDSKDAVGVGDKDPIADRDWPGVHR